VEESVTLKLEIENASTNWNAAQKDYTLEYLKDSKVLLADLSELTASGLTKPLLNDIYTLANNLQVEELVVAISLLSKDKNILLRDLIVFGFEITTNKKYTSNEEVISLSIEVNQEYDFVDLI